MARTSPASARALQLVVTLLLPGSVLAPARASAQGRAFATADYDVTVAVAPGGDYRVTERITYDFRTGSFRYLTREIPRRYIRDVRLVSLTSPATRIQGVAVTRSRGRVHIRAELQPTRGLIPVVLTYDVSGALFQRAGRDIVDWEAIGRAWRAPIQTLRVAVLLPAAFRLDSAQVTLAPPGGSLSRTPDGGWVAQFRLVGLRPRASYRVVVEFPARVPGRTDWPGLRARPAGLVLNPPLPSSYLWMIPLAALAGLLPGLMLFRLWGGPRREVTPESTPPAPLPRAAAILPESTGAPQRMFAAVLFDLAARGHLELRRVARGSRLTRRKRVEVTVHEEVDDPLTEFERGLLDEVRRYPALEVFSRKASSYRRSTLAALRRELVAEGLLEYHPWRSLLLALGCVAAFALGIVILAAGGRGLLPAGIFPIAGAIGLFLASLRTSVPTGRGALLRAQVLAYLAGLRQRVETLAAASPIQAAEGYMHDLPWLTLDTRVTGHWVGHILHGLKGSEGDLHAPGWAHDAAAATEASSGAYAAFLPYYLVTSAAAGAAAPGSGAAGAAESGAGDAPGGGGETAG